MITSDEKMFLEMSRSAHIMWKLFKHRHTRPTRGVNAARAL
jgi:hypothetical protein